MFSKRVTAGSSLIFAAIVMFVATMIVAKHTPCEADRFCTHRELRGDLDVRTW
jgi:hypothetical protein